jgi:hypothetical protein
MVDLAPLNGLTLAGGWFSLDGDPSFGGDLATNSSFGTVLSLLLDMSLNGSIS